MPASGTVIAPEQIADQRYAIPHRSAQKVRDWPAHRLTLDVEAGHFDGRVQTGIGQEVDRLQGFDLDQFQMERVHIDHARLELEQSAALVATANFTEADNAFVGDQFEHRAHEIAWMHS